MSETQNPVSTTEMWERVRDELDQLPWAEEALDSLRTRMEQDQMQIGQMHDRMEELEQKLAEKKQELAVAYGGGTTPPEREWFSALDKAEQERDELRANFTRWSQEKADELETFRTKIEQMEAVIEAAKVIDALAQRHVALQAFPGQMHQLHAALATLDQEEEA